MNPPNIFNTLQQLNDLGGVNVRLQDDQLRQLAVYIVIAYQNLVNASPSLSPPPQPQDVHPNNLRPSTTLSDGYQPAGPLVTG